MTPQRSEQKTKHTKGLWEHSNYFVRARVPQHGKAKSFTVTTSCTPVCDLYDHNNGQPYPNAEANAAFIVTACNNHDKLVELLMRLSKWGSAVHSNEDTSENLDNIVKDIDQALAAVNEPDNPKGK